MKFLRKGKKMLRAIVVLLLAGQAAVVALAANPTGSYSAGGGRRLHSYDQKRSSGSASGGVPLLYICGKNADRSF